MYSNIFPFQSFASLLLKKTIPGGWVVGWVVVLNENITTSAPIELGLGLSLAINAMLETKVSRLVDPQMVLKLQLARENLYFLKPVFFIKTVWGEQNSILPLCFSIA